MQLLGFWNFGWTLKANRQLWQMHMNQKLSECIDSNCTRLWLGTDSDLFVDKLKIRIKLMWQERERSEMQNFYFLGGTSDKFRSQDPMLIDI